MRASQILIAGALIVSVSGTTASAQTARFSKNPDPAPAAAAPPASPAPNAETPKADAAPAAKARRTFTRSGAPRAKQAHQGTTLAMVDADADGIVSRSELRAARARVADGPETGTTPGAAGATPAGASGDVENELQEGASQRSGARAPRPVGRLTLPPVPGTGAGAVQLLQTRPADLEDVVFRPRDTLPAPTKRSHPRDLVRQALEWSRAQEAAREAAANATTSAPSSESPSERDQRLARFRAQITERFDADGDGRLSRVEYGRAKVELAERRAAVIRKYDADGDGQLSSAERTDARNRIALARQRAAEIVASSPERIDLARDPARKEKPATAGTQYAGFIRIEPLDD